MIYRDYKDLKLSALGMGCMRLPVIDGDDAKVDNGTSELVMGRVLSKYPRESFYLADKFPGYDLSNMDKVEEIFEEQLKKCQTEYFDFYLFHNVCEMNIDAYLDESHGIHKYLM